MTDINGHSTQRPEILELLDAYLEAKSARARDISRQLHLFRLYHIRDAITAILSKVELAEPDRQILTQHLVMLFIDYRPDVAF